MLDNIRIKIQLSLVSLKGFVKNTIKKGSPESAHSINSLSKKTQYFFKGLNQEFQEYFKKDLDDAVNFFKYINNEDETAVNTPSFSFLQAAKLLLTYYPAKNIYTQVYNECAINILNKEFAPHTIDDLLDLMRSANIEARNNEKIHISVKITHDIAQNQYKKLSFIQKIKALVINSFILYGLSAVRDATLKQGVPTGFEESELKYFIHIYQSSAIRNTKLAQIPSYFAIGFLRLMIDGLKLLIDFFRNIPKYVKENFINPNYVPSFTNAIAEKDEETLEILLKENVIPADEIKTGFINGATTESLPLIRSLFQKHDLQPLTISIVLEEALSKAAKDNNEDKIKILLAQPEINIQNISQAFEPYRETLQKGAKSLLMARLAELRKTKDTSPSL